MTMWVFFDQINTKSLLQALYSEFFMVRRLITAFILVFMAKWPFFQLALMIEMSLIHLIYMIVIKPLEKSENKLEVFNELTIYLCGHMMVNLLNVATPVYLRDTLGWILMGLISFNVFANLVLVGYQTVYMLNLN